MHDAYHNVVTSTPTGKQGWSVVLESLDERLEMKGTGQVQHGLAEIRKTRVVASGPGDYCVQIASQQFQAEVSHRVSSNAATSCASGCLSATHGWLWFGGRRRFCLRCM